MCVYVCAPVFAINSFSWLIKPLTQLKTQIQHDVNEQGSTHQCGSEFTYWPQIVLSMLIKEHKSFEFCEQKIVQANRMYGPSVN